MKRRVNRISFIRLLGALLALGIGSQLWAVLPTSRQLRGDGFVPGEALVKVMGGPTSPAAADAHQQVGSTVLGSFSQIGWQHVQLPAGMTVADGIALYKQNPNVEHAEPNYRYRAEVIPNDPMYPQLWGMTRISAPTAWNASTGSYGTVVAVLDTGVDYTHPDIAANMWVNPFEIPENDADDDGNGYVDDIHGINALDGSGDPMDDNGHGTHVAGTIGAVGNNSIGVVGVNWNVRIMALKFLDDEGLGTTAGAIECLEYVYLMKMLGVNIRAINHSWGGVENSQALWESIFACGLRNIVSVCAAGNDGLDNDKWPHYPSNFELSCIISVAASDQGDGRAYFSNWGATSVDLAAPGVGILSTIPPELETIENNTGYTYMSGTSMAAPHVTGAVALLFSVQGSLTAQEVKAQLLASVDPVWWYSSTLTNGRLNLENLLRYYRVTFESPKADSIVYVERPTLVTKVTGLTSLKIKVNGQVVGTPTIDPATGEWVLRLGPLPSDYKYNIAVAGKDRYGADAEVSTTLQVRSKSLMPGKHMIALPVTDIGTATSVFTGITYPQLAVWNPIILQYQRYPQAYAELTTTIGAAIDRRTQTPVPPAGRGFWVDLPAMTRLEMPGDILRQERQYSVQILNGFNMIGNPYTFPTGFGSVLVEYKGKVYTIAEAAAAKLIEPVLYWWEGTGYRFGLLPDAVMQPWVGYWILCRADTKLQPMTLIFQPSPAGPARASVTPPAGKAQREVWEVAFNATNLTGGQQATVILGALEGATNQYDIGLDISAPPTAPDGLSLASRSGLGNDSLLRDYRPLNSGSTYRWDVTISGAPGSQIVLNWPKLTGLPKDYVLTLHDQVTGVDRYLRTSNNYTMTLGAQEQERQLSITAAPGSTGSLRVANLQAQRTRATGGATITCQVTQTSNVTVEIRTLSGRVIRRFTAATAAQGLVTANWDGANSRGRRVPRGAYLCHVMAETTSGQRATAVATLPW
jgi:subtilisin family serine protease